MTYLGLAMFISHAQDLILSVWVWVCVRARARSASWQEGFRAKFIQRSPGIAAKSSITTTTLEHFTAAMKRSMQRRDLIALKLAATDFQSQVIEACGEYLMEISLGTPAQAFIAISLTHGTTWCGWMLSFTSRKLCKKELRSFPNYGSFDHTLLCNHLIASNLFFWFTNWKCRNLTTCNIRLENTFLMVSHTPQIFKISSAKCKKKNM